MCHIKPPVTSKYPPISDERFWVLTLENPVHLRPCHDPWAPWGHKTAAHCLSATSPQCPASPSWKGPGTRVCSVCRGCRSRGNCHCLPGHWLLHSPLLFSLSFLGFGDSWVVHCSQSWGCLPSQDSLGGSWVMICLLKVEASWASCPPVVKECGL